MSATQSVPDWGSLFQQLANEFASLMASLLATINTTVIDVSRIASVTVLMLGILLYFTRVEKRLGKDLIKGGVILAVLAGFVFPEINRF
jgi:hypothetical protein